MAPARTASSRSSIDAPKPGPMHASPPDDSLDRLRAGAAPGPDRQPDGCERRHRESPIGALQRLRPAYAHLITLGEQGTGRAHARMMLHKITEVIAQGGWTQSERTTLYAARDKWRRRAEGLDHRYLLTGGQVRGVLAPEVQQGVDLMRSAQEALEAVQDELRQVRRESLRQPADRVLEEVDAVIRQSEERQS